MTAARPGVRAESLGPCPGPGLLPLVRRSSWGPFRRVAIAALGTALFVDRVDERVIDYAVRIGRAFGHHQTDQGHEQDRGREVGEAADVGD